MNYILPVLWITSCLSIIVKAKAMPIGHIHNVTHQMAALEAKYDVYDCLVWFNNNTKYQNLPGSVLHSESDQYVPIVPC